MFMEQMEKLLTVLAAYEPNQLWKFEILIILITAIVIGILLNNLYK